MGPDLRDAIVARMREILQASTDIAKRKIWLGWDQNVLATVSTKRDKQKLRDLHTFGQCPEFVSMYTDAELVRVFEMLVMFHYRQR